jgi:hypothetical protein
VPVGHLSATGAVVLVVDVVDADLDARDRRAALLR